jgi:hypothetical protein
MEDHKKKVIEAECKNPSRKKKEEKLRHLQEEYKKLLDLGNKL